jgi:hypothetical protein
MPSDDVTIALAGLAAAAPQLHGGGVGEDRRHVADSVAVVLQRTAVVIASARRPRNVDAVDERSGGSAATPAARRHGRPWRASATGTGGESQWLADSNSKRFGWNEIVAGIGGDHRRPRRCRLQRGRQRVGGRNDHLSETIES